MNDADQDPGHGPEEFFEKLRDRPTPQLDSLRLWRRIEAGLTPRSTSLWRRLFAPAPRPALRLGPAAAVLAVAALAAWMLLPTPPAATDGFVLLAPAEADGTVPPAATGEVVLDIRLVRGYDGAPPPDVRSARALGVGGADALGDVRARIETLLPHAEFGVVGAWQGGVADGAALDIELSDAYRLVARAARNRGGKQVRLDGIALVGAGGEPVSGDLTLEPGRLYFLGVVTPDNGARDLVLLIRAGGGERR